MDNGNIMISKELAQAVLNEVVYRVDYKPEGVFANTIRWWDVNDRMAMPNIINIHEMSYRCKLWAKNIVLDLGVGEYNAELYSFPKEDRWYCGVGDPCKFSLPMHWKKLFVADTEYEAIFNASQWILERIQNETKHES
jgi:hypothetical protein